MAESHPLNSHQSISLQKQDSEEYQDITFASPLTLEQHCDNAAQKPNSFQDLLDLIRQSNVQTQTALNNFGDNLTALRKDFDNLSSLKEQNVYLNQKITATQGLMINISKKQTDIKKQLTKLEQNQMDNSIVFYNVPYHPNENIKSLSTAIYKIMLNDMSIPAEDIFHSDPYGEIRIDNVYRMGKGQKDKPAPVVVRLLTKIGKVMVQTKPYIDNLKKQSKIRISELYPATTREKRAAQLDAFKQIKEDHKHSNDKIFLVKDKIMKNGKDCAPDFFESNVLNFSSNVCISYEELVHSTPITEKGSTFQAHKTTVTCAEEAAAALQAIYESHKLATSDHIMYAYRTPYTSGHYDDGEICGSNAIMAAINYHNAKNVFVCVTRKKNGPNIGLKRFELIKQTVDEILEKKQVDNHEESY